MDNKDFEIDFTDLFDNDIVSASSDLDMEKNKSIVLYAYVSEQTAKQLFKYFSFKQIWASKMKSMNENIISVPLDLYEYKEVAKALAPEVNRILIAFNINTDIEQIYDELNPFSNIKKTDRQIYLQRKKCEYNSKEYIKYTVRDARLVLGIQIKNWSILQSLV